MAKSHYGPEKHQVTRCTNCGMIFTNPQSPSYLKEVEQRGALDRHLDPDRLDRMCRNARLLLKLVEPHTSGRSLLDFGCGAGGMVKTAIDKGWNAIGYDLNSGLVDAANKHWDFNALQSGNLEDFYGRFPNTFDTIISFQVFEHLQQPVETGKKLVSLLKPGGVLLVDVPYVHQPMELIRRGKTLDPTSHWCHFSITTLSLLMEKIGCDVVYKKASPSFLNTYYKLGLTNICYSLGVLTKSVLPPIGTGVCVIARKPAP